MRIKAIMVSKCAQLGLRDVGRVGAGVLKLLQVNPNIVITGIL